MPSLFDRVSGISEDKLPINLIRSLASELSNGRVSPSSVVQVLGLNPEQTSDFNTLMGKAQASSDALAFSERVFAWLALSELAASGQPFLEDYLLEANFWQCVEQESVK